MRIFKLLHTAAHAMYIVQCALCGSLTWWSTIYSLQYKVCPILISKLVWHICSKPFLDLAHTHVKLCGAHLSIRSHTLCIVCALLGVHQN